MNEIDCTVIILAGGMGTRLRNVLPDQPKPLAKFGGRQHLIELLYQLDKQNIKKVILSLGYQADKIVQSVSYHLKYLQLNVQFIVEKQPLGTLGAVSFVANSVELEQAIVMNGDTICKFDFSKFLQFIARVKEQASGVICISEIDDAADYGAVRVGNGLITHFEEKNKVIGRAWVNMGIYWFSSHALKKIKTYEKGSIENELFPNYGDFPLTAYMTQSKFLDFGTPERFEIAQQQAGEMI
jgi:D-glycero-alpha-D-manno-heptose 1-phosphate guanylyltransferase